MVDFAVKTRIPIEADRALETILSKRHDTFELHQEVDKIIDLEVAKVIIKRLLDNIGG